MASSYTGFKVTECASFSDHAFYNYTNIEGMYHVIGTASDNRLIPLIIFLAIDLYLLFVLLFNTPQTADYLQVPYKRIFITCALGIFFHLFVLLFSVSSSSHDEAYLEMIWKGMEINQLWIIGYVIIIIFLYKIRRHNMTLNDSFTTKLKIVDVVALGILVELLLAFFYTPLVNRMSITSYRDGIKHTAIYGKLYLSEFMMILKQKNYYGLSGNVESYPYMIIPLAIIIAQVFIVLFKPKGRTIIIGILSLISIIVMTIGLCDMCDSIYANYICKNSRNFFKLVGAGYYFIIALNIALLCVYLWPKRDSNEIIIGVKEIEDIVNYETKKKNNNDSSNNEEINGKENLTEEKEIDMS